MTDESDRNLPPGQPSLFALFANIDAGLIDAGLTDHLAAPLELASAFALCFFGVCVVTTTTT